MKKNIFTDHFFSSVVVISRLCVGLLITTSINYLNDV